MTMTIKELNEKYNWKIPLVCPVCSSELVLSDSGLPECLNKDCARKLGHRFKKMFKTFGIKGCGEVFINNLENNDITIEDFLKMCKSNNKKIFNGFAGGINGEKVYAQMQTVLETPITVSKFLAIFDEKLFDEKRLSLLGYLTLDEILNLNVKDVSNKKFFGDKTAELFVNFISQNIDEINTLRNFFVFKKDNIIIEANEQNLPKICFTGACIFNNRKVSRNELVEMVIGKYEVLDSISNKTNILVCADPSSGSSKMQKAKKNGTRIMSYEEFLSNL